VIRGFPYSADDITVTPTAAGYLIGRILPIDDDGPWWEYLATAVDVQTARALAARFAGERRSRAWLYDGGYVQIPSIAAPAPVARSFNHLAT